MLKKLSVLIVAGILVGCTNIDNLGGKKDSGPIREIGGEPQIPGETKIVEDVPTDDGKVVNKEANNENIKEYLSIVKGNLKSSIKKIEDSVKNDYSVGLGETLIFPLDNEKAIKLTASPKNTNTKIIHKIFAKDDKEVIGNMINLNENQKSYLSNLRVGEAIIFSQGWMKCIHTKIEMGEKLHELEESKKDYSDKEVKELMFLEKIKDDFLEPFKGLNSLDKEKISDMRFTLNSFKNIFAKSDKNALIDDIDEFKEILEELKTNDNLRLFFITKHIERKKYKLILSKNKEVLKDEVEELNKKLSGGILPNNKIESYSFYFNSKIISR